MNAKRRSALLIVVLVALWVSAELACAVMGPALERHRRLLCRSNLRNCISYACWQYVDVDEPGGGEGRYPPTLGHLYPHYISDGEAFLCPSAGKATALGYDDSHFSADNYTPAMFGDTHTDYVYVSGLKKDDPKDYILAFDDEWNHDGDGVVVLRTLLGPPHSKSGWICDIKELHEQLAKQEKALAAQGREMKVLRPAWSTWPDPPPRPWYSSFGGRAAALGALVAIVAALALAVRKLKPDGSGARHDDTSDGRPVAGGEGSEVRG